MKGELGRDLKMHDIWNEKFVSLQKKNRLSSKLGLFHDV